MKKLLVALSRSIFPRKVSKPTMPYNIVRGKEPLYVIKAQCLTKKQLIVIAEYEYQIRKNCEASGIDFVPFEVFIADFLFEASKTPFEYQVELWKWYHAVMAMAKRGQNLEFNNPDTLHAAIVVACIIEHADKQVIINRNKESAWILSVKLCHSAIEQAKERGVQIVDISVKTGEAFTIWNEKGMYRHENNCIDHTALVNFKATG